MGGRKNYETMANQIFSKQSAESNFELAKIYIINNIKDGKDVGNNYASVEDAENNYTIDLWEEQDCWGKDEYWASEVVVQIAISDGLSFEEANEIFY